MNKILNLIQTLNNLKYIKRTGPTLFAGISSIQTDSIAEHSFKVANLSILLGNKVKGVNIGNLTIHALIHDWAESIVGDIPSSSKSFQSYFKINIRETFKDAEANILNTFLKDAKLKLQDLNETELKLLDLCDKLATTLELIDYKQKGNKHRWIDKMFTISISSIKQFDFDFIQELSLGLKDMFENVMDNYYLTKVTNK